MYLLVGIIALIILIAVAYFFSKGNSAEPEKDAKRFARLLISEIKLFNVYKVQRGLQNGSLVDSLRDEIAEARLKYKKRFPNADLENLFDDTIFKILVNGDKTKFYL
jgi:hypothetical protein